MTWRDPDIRPALGFALVVLVASLAPIPESAGESVPALLGVPLDKWAHAVGYGVLTGLLAWGRQTRDLTAVAGLAVLAAGYGAAIELLQGLVATRGFSTVDMLANAAGAAVAAAYVVARSR
jgi:VanZ family protein